MKKSSKNTPIMQSKSHSISQADLEHLLANLPGSDGTIHFEDLVWPLKDKKSLFVIDFRKIIQLPLHHPNWASRLKVPPVLLAKKLLLLATKDMMHVGTIKGYFNWIGKTLFFLAQHEVIFIGKENMVDFMRFQLSHDFKNEPTTRLRILTYRAFLLSPSIIKLSQVSAATNQPLLFDRSINTRLYSLACKDAVVTVSNGELTFSDWKTGGSFNFLTLDYGQFYIEHCLQTFETHYPMAIAMKSVLTNSQALFAKAGLNWLPQNSDNQRSYLILAINGISTTPKKKTFSQEKWEKLIQLAQEQYEQSYRLQQVQHELVSEQTLTQTAEELKIDLTSPDEQNWFQEMVKLLLEFNTDTPEDIKIRSNIQSILGKRLNLEKLRHYLKQQVDERFSTCTIEYPTQEYFTSVGVNTKSKHGDGVQYQQFLKLIEVCGFTAFIATNGWRASEYGFSLSNISIEANRDILDQWYNPLRFTVRWLVPKVHAENQIDREITFNSYRLCAQMAKLLTINTYTPCLYPTIGTKQDMTNSTANTKQAVSYAWDHFVGQYAPFRQMDEAQWHDYEVLCRLRETQNNNIKLTKQEQNQLEKLAKCEQAGDWQAWTEQPLLVSAYRRARSEQHRIQFKHLVINGDKKELIWAFVQNILEGNYQILFSQYLTEETQSFLHNLSNKSDLSNSIVKAVTAEILTDCAYPTPHALRHMWAEAVFRRFDGDVGWMIRSQFKHISQSMWLAYIRDKQRNELETVKRQVVSDLLAHYIQKAGKGYAGGMDRRLRLMMKQTKITSIEEMTDHIQEYGLKQIKDIKASPYGFCLLQHRNQTKAKCAEDGEPQRQNASPDVCFGCQFNLSMTSNLHNILLSIANHRIVLQAPIMLPSYRATALQTVKNALAQTRKLGAPIDIIEGIEADLAIGKKNYQNDLKGDAA